jgi:Flp pilus assembly secretin CpaC
MPRIPPRARTDGRRLLGRAVLGLAALLPVAAVAGASPPGAEAPAAVTPVDESTWVGADGQVRHLYRPRFVAPVPLYSDAQAFGVPSVRWDLDPARGRLLLTGAPAGLREAFAALAWLDVPPPQALVEVTIVEAIRRRDVESGGHGLFDRWIPEGAPDTFFRGLRWDFEPDRYLRRALVGDRPFEGSDVVFGRSDTEGPLAGTLRYVLRGLVECGEASLLANPMLVCTQGVPAHVTSTMDLPTTVFTRDPWSTQLSLVSEKTGVRLEVLLEHVGSDQVRLRLKPWLRQIAEGAAESGPLGAPVLVVREAETVLTIPDDTTLVVAGMQGVRRVRDRRGFPWLDALPAVDVLASARRKDDLESDLLILVRARILQPGRGRAPALPPGEIDRLRRKTCAPSIHESLDPPR